MLPFEKTPLVSLATPCPKSVGPVKLPKFVASPVVEIFIWSMPDLLEPLLPPAKSPKSPESKNVAGLVPWKPSVKPPWALLVPNTLDFWLVKSPKSVALPVVDIVIWSITFCWDGALPPANWALTEFEKPAK